MFFALYNKEINAVGTIRPTRRAYPLKHIELKASVHNRGHYKYVSNGPLLACSWVDKRTSYFLCILHPANLPPGTNPPTVKRKTLDGSQTNVECPPLLPDYQAFMRGVDRGDQAIAYYNIGRRSTKWWKRIFSYMIESAILNSYVVDGYVRTTEHSMKGRAKMDFLKFRLEVATDLVGSFSSRKRPGRRVSSSHDQHERLNPSLGHWPAYVESKSDCVVYAARITKHHIPRSDNRHESRVICSVCKVHPLCCQLP